MIEPTSSLTPMPAGPAANAASAAAPGGFVLALGAFLDASASLPPAPSGVAARQDDAVGGKDVPDERDAQQDDADDAVSIWMPSLIPFAGSPAIADVPAPSAPSRNDLIAAGPATVVATQMQIPAARPNPLPDTPESGQPVETKAANATSPVTDAAAAAAPSALPIGIAVTPVAITKSESDPSSAHAVSQASSAPSAVQIVPGADRRAATDVSARATTTAPWTFASTTPFERSGDARRFSAVSPGQRNPVLERAAVEQATPTPTALANASMPMDRPGPAAMLPVSNTVSVASSSLDASDASGQPETGRPSADDGAGSIPLPAVMRATPSPVGTVQPARQAFAAALSALSSPRRTRGQTAADFDTAAPASHDLTAAVASSSTVPGVTQSQEAALDLRQDRGLARMLDHIERLRDDADASDTRIRLVPDALGTVDVAVRKDGEAVHVHFTAASEATRAAIADAQPRLADLAESRGVKIAGSSIDAGAGGQDRPTPQPRSESLRPAPAPRRSAATISESTNDQRLA